MTFHEFKAWYDGYLTGLEAVGKGMSAEQIATVGAKLATVETDKKPMPVYRGWIDHGMGDRTARWPAEPKGFTQPDPTFKNEVLNDVDA